MQAFVQTAIGRFEERELPAPRPAAGEAVVRVRRGDSARELAVDVPAFQQAVPHVSARPIAPGDARGIPNNDQQKINQPPEPAGPNLQDSPREPRANR